MSKYIAVKLKSTVGVLIACASFITYAQAGDEPANTTANATNRFIITGMSCDGCALGIASELKRAPGVMAADVSFSNKLAVVAYDTNSVSADGLKKVITEAGYEAKLVKLTHTKRH